MTQEEAKEILRKNIRCEIDTTDCTGKACRQCENFVFGEKVAKASQIVLDALEEKESCVGCKYNEPGLILLPCETCRRGMSDNYEAEDQEETT